MARLTVGEKGNRAARFIVAVRKPLIAAALREYGFTPADLDDGMERLRSFAGARLDAQVPPRAPDVIKQLDELENAWFPIARGTLVARYPETAKVLFRNLTQQSGVGVVFSMTTFVKRLGEMERGEGGFGEEGPRARQVLADRGMTPAKVREAQALLDAMGTLAPTVAVTGPTREELAESEQRLWAWYREWSCVARVAVKDKTLLRSLGLAGRHTRDTEEDAVPEAPPELPVAGETPRLLGVSNAAE